MKLLLLSDLGSPHTVKWVRALSGRGIDVLALGRPPVRGEEYAGLRSVEVRSLGAPLEADHRRFGGLGKLRYLGCLPRLRAEVRRFAPDILHAHYATSYGLLGALSGFRPFVLSVWGSDVFSFPRRSRFHAWLLRYNLRRAETVLSTSHAMAAETRRYTTKEVLVTPFGVDLDEFRPLTGDSLFAPDEIVIGTIKTLEDKYGVDYLLRAFALVVRRFPEQPLRLLIVGGGAQAEALKALARDLGLGERVVFAGPVPHSEVVRYYNMLDVYVALSVAEESFGVAVIEASACEKPVIVSDRGGLPEVVEDGVTGLVVPARDPSAAAEALARLVGDPQLRASLGRNGRERVRRLYAWDDCVERVIEIYEGHLARRQRQRGAPQDHDADPLPRGSRTALDVRAMTEGDVAHLAEIHLAAFAGYMNSRLGQPYIHAVLDWFRTDAQAIALTATWDGRPAGYAIGAPLGYQRRFFGATLRAALLGAASHPWVIADVRMVRIGLLRLRRLLGRRRSVVEDPSIGSLVGIGVDPSLGGRGIGGGLLSAFEAAARARRLVGLQLSVYNWNHGARRLYEKAGWQVRPMPGEERTLYYFKDLDRTFD